MTANRRIILNIVASYGRTLLGAFCGIFSVRWVLLALGEEGYGLFGVIGSLAIFLTFLNTQFSGALSRFYAYSIGKAKSSGNSENGLEECRSWFSIGVMVHLFLSTILVSIGYPVGWYAITHEWLTIPTSRVDACVWLWRFVCVSCFVSMANVPFHAMYQAKQYIAELTIYSVAQVVFRTGFIFYMTMVERDWLVDYGLMSCLVVVIPAVAICVRALQVFPECRLHIPAFKEFAHVSELAKYAWWQIFVGIGYMARHQCLELVVNKLFGPRVNSAYTVGATVGGEAAALTGALNAAFSPAITTACGAGDLETMRAYAYRASKFGTLLTLLFAIPMGVEINELLALWLKTPPLFAEGLCLCWLIVVVIEKLSLGHIAAVFAMGEVAKFCFFRGGICFMAIPFALIAAFVFKSVYSIGGALVLTTILVGVSDVVLARKRAGMSSSYFVKNILSPLIMLTVISVLIGIAPRFIMEQSFHRLVVATLVELSVFIVLSWFFVLDSEERVYIWQKVKSKFSERAFK